MESIDVRMAGAAAVAVLVGGWLWWGLWQQRPRSMAGLRGVPTSTCQLNLLGLVGGVLVAWTAGPSLAVGLQAAAAADVPVAGAAPLTVVGVLAGGVELGYRGFGLWNRRPACPRLAHFPFALLGPLILVGVLPLVSHAAAKPAAPAVAVAAPAPGAVCSPAARQPAVPKFTAEQIGNAAGIVAVGRSMGAPPRAQTVAVATAMQESTLHNWPGGDKDSAGLFQQRPSMGWGTFAQVTDAGYAARTFYTRLLAIPGWDRLPVTVAAQAVQHSGFPNAYAKWEPAAGQMLAAVAVTCTNPK